MILLEYFSNSDAIALSTENLLHLTIISHMSPTYKYLEDELIEFAASKNIREGMLAIIDLSAQKLIDNKYVNAYKRYMH